MSARDPAPIERANDAVIRVLPVGRDDAAIVAALRARQPGFPALLVDRYGKYVERILARAVGVDSELPDLVQEVFLQAIGNLRTLRDPSAIKPWLGSLAIHTARTWIRRRRTRRRWLQFGPPEKVPEQRAPVAPPEINQVLKRTYEVLDKLPADERIAFALRFVEGTDLETTAELCGVSLSTIKRRLGRAERRFLEAARRDPILCERLSTSPRWRDK